MKDNAHIFTQFTRHNLVLVPRASDKKPLLDGWSAIVPKVVFERGRFLFTTPTSETPIKTTNISLRCDSLLVFDFDLRDKHKSTNGEDWTRRYRDADGTLKFLGINPLHRLFLQTTPSGGLHYVFLVDSSVKDLIKVKCFSTDLFDVDIFLNTPKHLICVYDPIINVMPVVLSKDVIHSLFHTNPSQTPSAHSLGDIFPSEGDLSFRISKKQRERVEGFLSSVNASALGGNRYSFRCPCHDDKNPSAGLILDKNILYLKCFAGCASSDLYRVILGSPPAPAPQSTRKKNNTNGDIEKNDSGKITDIELMMIIRDLIKDKYVWTKDSGWYLYCNSSGVWREVSRSVVVQDVLCSLGIDCTAWRMRNVLEVAVSGMEGILDALENFDAVENKICVTNGVIDTAEYPFRLLPHSPSYRFLSRVNASFYEDISSIKWQYDTWVSFISKLIPDEEERRELQRVLGLSLCSNRGGGKFYIWYGVGANGKTTVVNILKEVLGDYVGAAPMTLLLNKSHEHPTEFFSLKGKRLVFVSETEGGDVLNSARVKLLTGNDTIPARKMFRDYTMIKPTWSLFLITNHLPRITDMGHGLWRRIHLTGWKTQIPPEEQIPQAEILSGMRACADGILYWLLEGYADYLREPKWESEKIKEAVKNYLKQEDALGLFIEECCELNEYYKVSSSTLYRAYVRWCEENGFSAPSKIKFSKMLQERGIEPMRFYIDEHTRTRGYIGIRLLNLVE
ncbi:MAG: phage/plasmid primase, P4 family [candidate division WOR-3 bacterium]